jgi:CBS domain-containing membrane protein
MAWTKRARCGGGAMARKACVVVPLVGSGCAAPGRRRGWRALVEVARLFHTTPYMSAPILVQTIMSHPVIAVQSDHSIHFAISLMRSERIRHLPVVDGHRLVGLVTQRDLLSAESSLLSAPFDALHSEESLSVPVSEVMRTSVWSVDVDTPVLEAARIMRDHKFGCLPVLDEEKLVGIVTAEDFLTLLVTSLERRREREDTGRFVFPVA